MTVGTSAPSLAVAVNEYTAVGTDFDQRLQWLGDFAQRELVDEAACRRAASELNAFIALCFAGSGSLEIVRLTAPSDAPEIQRVVRDVLRGLAPGLPVWLDEKPIEIGAIGNALLWRQDRGVMVMTRLAGAGSVIAAVVDLLIAIGPRLRRCEGCSRLFALSRPHQKFCSTQCGLKHRVAKWRAAHPEKLADQRHQQYERRVKAKLPRARVARRRRRMKA
jgi:hypothetical protein